MKISEAITELRRYMDEHGDIDVVDTSDEAVWFEVQTDGGETVVVVE